MLLPMSNSNSNNELPAVPPNPILTAYEGWVQRTPLVTRYIVTLQIVSYLLNGFIDLHSSLATIPHHVIFQLELHRLILSPVVNKSFVWCLFALFSFSDHGKRLEQAMGSAAFGWLFLTIGFVTNCAFTVVCVGLSLFIPGVLYMSSAGLGTMLFGMIAMECVQAPQSKQRSFLFITVPIIYYPMTLFAFFAFFSPTLAFSYLVALGVGYACGFGYLDKLKLSSSKAKQWEDTILTDLVRREGWITGQYAIGSSAWHDVTSSGGGASNPWFGGGGSTSTSSGTSAAMPGLSSNEGGGGGSVYHRPASSSTDSSTVSFPASAGRTLGGGGGGGSSSCATSTTRRTAAETRAARLQALERKAQEMDIDA